MSRRELLDDFLAFVTESGDDLSRDIAERLYNRALMTIWRKHPWRQFRMPQPFTFTVTAGQRSYALPRHFGRIAGGKIRNITVPCDLVGMEPEMVETLHPEAGTDEEVAGRPDIYTVSGTCGVDTIVSTPEALTVVSTDATDLSTVRWAVQGYDANFRWQRIEGAMTGTVAVNVGTLIPWTFSKAYTEATTPPRELTSSAGTVTLSGATSGVLQQLFNYESAVEQQVLTLYPIPNASGDTMVVPYLRRPVRSLYDADVVPMDWSEAIFEEMVIQWRVNQGEMPADSASNAMRPKFLDLLAFENGNRFGYPGRTRPFIG